MAFGMRKFVIVLVSTLVAALITCGPWVVLAKATGPISQLFGMTAILWAPLALIVGIASGVLIAVFSWPRTVSGL